MSKITDIQYQPLSEHEVLVSLRRNGQLLRSRFVTREKYKEYQLKLSYENAAINKALTEHGFPTIHINDGG